MVDNIKDHPDMHFYQSFDPGFFLRVAAQFMGPPVNTPTVLNKLENTEENQNFNPFDIILDNFDSTKITIIHAMRYLSSEMLMNLLISGSDYGTYIYQNHHLKQNILNGIIEDIADRKIPKKYEIIKNGNILNFSEWINELVNDTKFKICTSFSEFVKSEADFIKKRGLINAFKHGRLHKSSEDQIIKFSIEYENESIDLLDSIKPCVSYISYEKSDNKYAFSISIEKADVSENFSSLFISAHAMSAIKNYRLGKLGLIKNVNLNFPCDIKKLPSKQCLTVSIK